MAGVGPLQAAKRALVKRWKPITCQLADGHETPQKSHWGVTKVLSKIQSETRALFVRTGEVETPFPGRFLQPLVVTEAEAESSTLQKEFSVKQGRRTPPALDRQNGCFVGESH